jgi:hypothetical protein
VRYEIRPLEFWDRPKTDPRRSIPFRAKWGGTLELLAREIELLGGDLIVLQVDVKEGEIRRDGMLAARAKVGFPGVKVSFDSRHGPLTYATDVYEGRYNGDMPDWQANVRAIALALEALRAVDRYGVTSRGEQYRGWTAIAAAPGEFDMTREEAAKLLAGEPTAPWSAGDILHSPGIAASAYRWAAKKHHPDLGGDAELFRRLTAARDILLGKGANV